MAIGAKTVAFGDLSKKTCLGHLLGHGFLDTRYLCRRIAVMELETCGMAFATVDAGGLEGCDQIALFGPGPLLTDPLAFPVPLDVVSSGM